MNNTTAKAALAFVTKSAIFTVVFWALWLVIFRPLSSAQSNQSDNSSTAGTNALMKTYWEQVKRTELLQNQSEVQLKKQGELLLRWERVIEKWENQASR